MLFKADSPNPRSPTGYRKLGHLLIQNDKTSEASQYWRKALAANPDDERIANRIAWLAPANEGVWAVDVPSDEDIESAIAKGKTLKAFAGSDVAYLLDDEVTLLNGDGSTTNVVTMVAKALNQRVETTSQNENSLRWPSPAAACIRGWPMESESRPSIGAHHTVS